MDKYADLTLTQLAALHAEKKAAFDALTDPAVTPDPTGTQVNEATGLRTEMAEITTEMSARQTAMSENKSATFDAKPEKAEEKKAETKPAEDSAESRTVAPSSEINEGDVKGASGNAEGEVRQQESPGVVVPPGETASEETEQAGSAVEALAAKSGRPSAPQGKPQGKVRITAAPETGFVTGSELDDLVKVAQASITKAQAFPVPQGNGGAEDIRKFATAQFAIDYPEEFMVDAKAGEATMLEALDRAANESRLPGGSLTAAGGWCAPSETVYDLTQDATTEGMLSLPEIGVRRGGIRFAMSPTFADFYANPGFIQTETQAIAGTTKTCVEVDCPDFEEVRLDVEGVCIKVPILTNVGYPEYVRNFIDGTLVAHQHWINANRIGRLVTAAGAARVITGLGATMTDTLEGLELLANQTRQKYRLSMKRTLEVVLPFWVLDMVKSDLRRRNGQLTPVTDQQVQQHFSAAKLNVQFVYDWQVLDETAEVYPATFNALMYPAGTFVAGNQPVITLNTIYDAASLATNVYTGLFTEQGFLIAHRKFHADLITLPICNAGRVGAADLTCGAGV